MTFASLLSPSPRSPAVPPSLPAGTESIVRCIFARRTEGNFSEAAVAAARAEPELRLKFTGRNLKWFQHSQWIAQKAEGAVPPLDTGLLHFAMACIEFEGEKLARTSSGDIPTASMNGVATKVSRLEMQPDFNPSRELYVTPGFRLVERLEEFLDFVETIKRPPTSTHIDDTESGQLSTKDDVYSELRNRIRNVRAEQKHGERMNLLTDLVGDLSKSLAVFGVQVTAKAQHREIRGVRRKTLREIAGDRLPWVLVFELILEALVSVMVVMLPALLVIGVAVLSQDVWSLTVGLDATPVVEIVALPSAPVDDDYYLPVQVVIIAGLIMLSLVLMMLALSHFDFYTAYAREYRAAPPTSGSTSVNTADAPGSATATVLEELWGVIARLFGWSYFVLIFMFYVYSACAILWIFAAVFVDPTKNLMIFATVILAFVIARFIYAQVTESNQRIRRYVYEALDDKLEAYIKRKLKKITKATGGNLSDLIDGNPTLANLFDAYRDALDKVNENVPLIKPEYFAFLDDLGFKITVPTKERMFAFADVDGNGAIEIDELQSTWEYFKEMMYERTAARLGLTELQLIGIIFGAVTGFVLFATFVILVIEAFAKADSFSAVIGTIILGVTQIIVLVNRVRAAAELMTPEEMRAFIKQDLQGVTGAQAAEEITGDVVTASDVIVDARTEKIL